MKHWIAGLTIAVVFLLATIFLINQAGTMAMAIFAGVTFLAGYVLGGFMKSQETE